jgi:hypothetical protein
MKVSIGKKNDIEWSTGMISRHEQWIERFKKQYEIAEKALFQPLKKNYDTAILAWQNNNWFLPLLDAWDAKYGSN